MEIDEILKKMRAISESEDTCNKSKDNKFCPVHGFGGCPAINEDDDKLDDDDLEDEDIDDLEDEDDDKLDDEDTDDLEDEDDDRSVDDNVNIHDKAKIKAKDDEYYNAIIDGKVPEDVVEPERFMRYYEKTYGKTHVKESVHITLDGQEADAFIQRLSVLAGQPINAQSEVCPNCNLSLKQCTCKCCPNCGNYEDECCCDDQEEHCPHCGNAMNCCGCDGSVEATFGPDGVTMENADHDFGNQDHPDVGEPVDPDSYMYKAPNGPQRVVKGMLGDNSLIKEDAKKLFTKLKNDYKSYVAEADLAASNTPGANSPLTSADRDEFNKDPFAGDEAVTDGSRSPLSTIKRQKVLK